MAVAIRENKGGIERRGLKRGFRQQKKELRHVS